MLAHHVFIVLQPEILTAISGRCDQPRTLLHWFYLEKFVEYHTMCTEWTYRFWMAWISSKDRSITSLFDSWCFKGPYDYLQSVEGGIFPTTWYIIVNWGKLEELNPKIEDVDTLNNLSAKTKTKLSRYGTKKHWVQMAIALVLTIINYELQSHYWVHFTFKV